MRKLTSKGREMIEGFQPPCVVFRTRVRDETIEGPNPYRWQDVTSDELLQGRRVALFSLPGAFTPTCSTMQLPGFEDNYPRIKELGIDEVYCISVNDAYVMNAWAKHQAIESVKVIPDGSGNFTRYMGMLIGKKSSRFWHEKVEIYVHHQRRSNRKVVARAWDQQQRRGRRSVC